MELKTNVLGGAKLQADLRKARRDIRVSVATGLTKTAGEAKLSVVGEMRRVFDRPTLFTRNAVYTEGADATAKQTLVDGRYLIGRDGGKGVLAAVVGLKSDPYSAPFLAPQVVGGTRPLKRFEKALQAKGAMPAGWYAVPTRNIKLDKDGNVSRGQINQILSHLGTELTAGFSRTLPRGDNKKDKTKRRRAYGRAEGQYVAIVKRQGKLAPGIYLAGGRDFGAKLGYGRNGSLVPMFRFVPIVIYRKRLDFYGTVHRISNQRLLPNIQLGLNRLDILRA